MIQLGKLREREREFFLPDRREDYASMASIHCNGPDQREDWAAWGGCRSAWGTEDCNDLSMVAAIGTVALLEGYRATLP